MQFVVFEKFTNVYSHQISLEIKSSPINNLYDKGSQKVKTAHVLKMSTKKCLTDVVPYWQTLLRSMIGIHICQLFYLFILHRLMSLQSNVVQHCTSTQNHANLFRCHSNFCMQHMKSPFPSAERLLDHHSRFCVCTIVGFLGWSSCCCKRCH